MRIWILLGLMVSLGSQRCAASEPVCFRTPAEAAEQAGVRGTSGYRLESVRRDVYAGTVWAEVRSCEHPERPGVLVLGRVGQSAAVTGTAALHAVQVAVAPRTLVLQAGARVRLVLDDGVVRLETGAIALGSGAVGDEVRVRIVPVSEGAGGEQIATGVVRGAGLVEVGR